MAQETAETYDINVPWLIRMDPTSACNMRCTGCVAGRASKLKPMNESPTAMPWDSIRPEIKDKL